MDHVNQHIEVFTIAIMCSFEKEMIIKLNLSIILNQTITNVSPINQMSRKNWDEIIQSTPPKVRFTHIAETLSFTRG